MRASRSIAVAGAACTFAVAHIAVGSASAPAPPAAAVSPLARYPGFGHDPEADHRASLAEEAQRQRMIASCMISAGFDYAPAMPIVVRGEHRRHARPTDPNEAYRSRLGATQLRRYNLTLYGVPDPNDEANLWDPGSPTGGGCWGEALRATVGDVEVRGRLNREHVAMRRSLARHPAVLAEERRWSACMRESGFAFGMLSDFRAAQSNRGEVPGRPIMAMADVDRAGAASRECLAATDYEGALRQATLEAETAFVERNRGALDRLNRRR